MPLISVKNIVKYYSTQRAVNDISFDIEEGSIFGLLGPNGAGKSTLLRMITGIFYHDEGEILFDGKPFDLKVHQNLIGYMPEERGLYKKMNIGEQVMYLAQLKGMSKDEATKAANYWFSRLGMETWWNKKTEDLSKGMGQKLQFVSTVIHNPKLLILDEPFSGLDPVNANVLKDEIYNLAKNGTTIIFSTHRMEQVEEICDKIILINQGQKLLDGNVHELKKNYKENKFFIKYEGNATLKTELAIIIKQDDKGIVFMPKEGVTSNQVIVDLINQGVFIEHFNEILPSLNDIFIQLVGNAPAARQFSSN